MELPFGFAPTRTFGTTHRGRSTSVGLSNRILRTSSLPYFSSVDFHLFQGLGKGIENSKGHSSRLAQFKPNMSLPFWLVLVSPTDL